ncbi:hypothetical protein WA026_002096 [Henosepilachna vigintioctopunctata]|uniref:Tyr recombinase domain-containing protein n=2 Tax=Henosepilachna vigintioctopunctata TaxID=420089 RepID=A0AAW1U0U1_9CUCU
MDSLQVMQTDSKSISPTDERTERIEISYCNDGVENTRFSPQKESWNISSPLKNDDILNPSQVDDLLSSSEDDDMLSPLEDDEDYHPNSSSSSESYHCVKEISEIAEKISKNSTASSKSLAEFGKETNTRESDMNSKLGKLKMNGEKRKGNKGKDYCIYCDNLVLNFARHIQNNHSYEVEVRRIFSLPPKSKERTKLLSNLRKQGNFINSSNIRKPVRASSINDTNVLPCTDCMGLYSVKQLWRHRKKCCANADRNHRSLGQNMLLAHLKIDPKLREEVFPRMRADNISLQAKKDQLICAFGSRYITTHREKHLAIVASRKMRELSKLLIEVRKYDASIKNLFEALQPKYFDSIVDATKIIAKYNFQEDRFNSPTLALNMGTTLKQCCNIAIVFVLKRKEICSSIPAAEAEANLKTMIHLIETNWCYEISKKAATDLKTKKWNKVTIIPLASDLKIFREYLVKTADLAIKKLDKENTDKESYLALMEVIFCRIILLNRRRPGELERLPLYLYENTDSLENKTYEEFAEVVTPSERILLKSLKRIVIRGKRGRGVPVLFPCDVQNNLKIALKCRNKVFDQDNIYLFGNPKTSSTISGYKVLKKHAGRAGLKNPEAITSTRLRKHLATLSQLFNMTESDIEQLASFMGHTVGVHRGSYRLPNDIFQTAKLSKILLLMEKGDTSKFKGKQIQDIEVDFEKNLLSDEENEEKENERLSEEKEIVPKIIGPVGLAQVGLDQERSRTKTRVLVPWTQDQKNIIQTFFAEHIRKRKPPRKRECEQLIENYPEVFINKNWKKIKVFIQNVYTKK